jgi:hypothetical protein
VKIFIFFLATTISPDMNMDTATNLGSHGNDGNGGNDGNERWPGEGGACKASRALTEG